MKRIVLVIVFFFCFKFGYSQTDNRIITTGVPFLLVTPDARAGGLGDQGVATSPDGYSQYWNPSKYGFLETSQGFTASFTPYLTQLVSDVNLSQLTYYNQISDKGTFSVGFRYFGFGDIEFRQNLDDVAQIRRPNELAADVAYSLKLSEQFGMGVTLRYINSNLRIPNIDPDASSASAFSVDISGYHESKEFAVSDYIGKYRLGFNIQNLGPKLKYGSDTVENFLPANLKVGGGFDFILDEYNTISVTTEINKLLVPSPQPNDLNGDGIVEDSERTANQSAYRKIDWTSGIFKSFGDASGGTKEELQEVIWAVGAEYVYQDAFALRAGYYHESAVKGLRKYYTIGAGFKYNTIAIDMSYIFSTSKIPNPLEGTLRFSLTFNFGDIKSRSDQ